jgi:hypothetical protein
VPFWQYLDFTLLLDACFTWAYSPRSRQIWQSWPTMLACTRSPNIPCVIHSLNITYNTHVESFDTTFPPHITLPTTQRTLSPPYELWGLSNPGWDSPPWKFMSLTENYCPLRPTSKKPLSLHSWRPLDYKSHIECTSPSRSTIQYICALPINNINNWLRFHSGNETINEARTELGN